MEIKNIHTGLRMPADILEKIRQSAKTNTRSVSAEIIHRIKLTFTKGK